MVDPAHTRLSLVRQCRFVSIARSSFYYGGTGESPLNLRLMRSIDAQFLETPFYEARGRCNAGSDGRATRSLGNGCDACSGCWG